MNAAPAATRPWSIGAVVALATLLALPFTIALGLGHRFSHDEGQHLAAGVLFAKEGLLPYRDFAYFHTPYLLVVYGALFQLTDHYFLAARLFGAGCAALLAGAVAGAAWQIFAAKPPGQRALIALGAALLLLGTPLFADSVGYCWNQEPSVLLAVLAFLAHTTARTPWRTLLSGALLGLAIGMRITIAPLVLPFAIMLWRDHPREKWRLLAWFAAGLTLALLPVAAAFLSAPREFLFGNVEFPKVNVAYRFASGEPRTMTLLKKLRFLFKEVMRPNGLLCFGFLALWLISRWRAPTPLPRMFLFLLLVFPFLLLGGLAPSPVFDQYFFPLLPFLVLGFLCLLAAAPRRRGIWSAVSALVLISAGWRFTHTDELPQLFQPPKWEVTKMQDNARALRRAVPSGKVLTLNPAVATEAGLAIYPQLVTGPFAWRVADLLAPARRPRLHILAPADLPALLAHDPPAAILLGAEKRWEAPLAAYAKAHGYRRAPFPDSETLWLAPGTTGN